MKFTVTFDVIPSDGQSQADAETEMAKLFRAYLSDVRFDSPFITDYHVSHMGEADQGGYDGPWVKGVRVRKER